MTRRTLHLIERRTREVELRRAEVDFLLAHARNVIDIVPTFRHRVYRLTPRGFVGVLDSTTVRFVIRPKLPWANLLLLLGLASSPAPAGERVEPGSGLLAVLAEELASRLVELTHGGLVRGYREQDTESPFLRGRLRTADQLRDAAARAFPDRFHITAPVFDLDTPWNRIPKGIASELLRHPGLPAATHNRLAAALVPLAEVPAAPVTDADFDAAGEEPRAVGYNGVLTLCRLIRDGLPAAGAISPGPPGSFLVDLGRVFEQHLTRTLTAVFGPRPGWSVEAQPRFVLQATGGEPVELQPDVVIRRHGAIRAVLDAKWKKPGPAADDVHQILAYAAVTGATRVGLVYPGSRFARRDLVIPGGKQLSLFRLSVTGTAEECEIAARRLAREVCR